MLLRLAILSLLGIATAAFAEPADRTPLIADAQLEAAGMYSYWKADLPLLPGDSVVEGHLVDDALYVITDRGNLFAMTAGQGLIRWAENVTEADYVIYRPMHLSRADGSGRVVVPTTTAVFVYDRFNGDMLRRFTTEFPISGPAAGYGNRLFMGSSDGKFYSIGLDPRTPEPVKLWEVAAGGPVTATPALYGDRMLTFASQGGKVYSCRSEDKGFNWSFSAGGPVFGDPAVDDEAVYVASMNRSLYKVDRESGKTLWQRRMPRPLREGPIVVGDLVYQYCVERGVAAIDAATGEERWRVPDGRMFVAHSPNGDFLMAEDERLLLVDTQTGDLMHTFDVPGAAGTVVNTLSSAVYVLGKDGRVLCAQLADVPFLHRQQVQAARNRLQLPPHGEQVPQAAPTSRKKVQAGDDDPFRSPRDKKPPR